MTKSKAALRFKKSLAYHIIRALRPRQWLKNLSIFAGPFFWGNLLDGEVLLACIKAFFVFVMASSATYLINDVVDAENDRNHPIKKNRPIANRDIPEWFALTLAFLLMTGSLVFSLENFSRFFVLTVISYFALQITYSLYLRNVIIIDALTVASGFVLRVFAGTFASKVPISSWLVLAVIGLSLLLAFGKRRAERTILASQNIPLETRDTLKHYPDNLLDSMISMSATFAIVSYSLFAFQTNQTLTSSTLVKNLPITLSSPKLLMLTIPIVIYGVARYLYVIYEKNEAESPERVFLSDAPLLNSIGIWVLLLFILIYGLQGS
ncbi:MAG: decaprenyl-phosphate phosphoribosyltransferase [Patescibacteria group bacterium]